MAIAKIKHIDIFFTKEQKEMVVYLIQKLGIIQLLQLKEVSPQPRQEPSADLEKIEEAIAYLESLSAKKGMFLNKPYLDYWYVNWTCWKAECGKKHFFQSSYFSRS